MEVLIVVPKYTYQNLSIKKNYHYVFPVGMAYIAAVVKRAEYNPDVINLNHLDGKIADNLNKKLDSKNYDIICTGHTGIGCPVIEKITEVIRNHHSKPKILLGGALITSEPELMADLLDFDFAIVGEGEQTVVELLDHLKENRDLGEVDGLIIKDKMGNKIFTKPRRRMRDLDSLPFPDFEALGYDEYLDNMASNDGQLFGELDYPRCYYILGSRGCAFQCTFCYHSLGVNYSERSFDNIIEEIKFALKRYKINHIYFYDDLFNVNKRKMYEFCKKIKPIVDQNPWRFRWTCQSWVGGVDKDLLREMKNSGCSWVSFGFESYSDAVLKSMHKPTTSKNINETVEALKELKMPILGNFIFGDVAETKETANETLKYWEENCEGQIKLDFIQQYPGSRIYNISIEKGLIKDKEDFIKNRMTHNIYSNFTENMTDEEYEELQKHVYKAKRKYMHYIVPTKMDMRKDEIYDLEATCPYCKETINYKNCFIKNKKFFTFIVHCRNCPKRFFVCSFLYKINAYYYHELEFLRSNYLRVKDKILRASI